MFKLTAIFIFIGGTSCFAFANSNSDCQSAIQAIKTYRMSGAGKTVLKEASQSACAYGRVILTNDSNIQEIEGFTLAGYGDIVRVRLEKDEKSPTLILEIAWKTLKDKTATITSSYSSLRLVFDKKALNSSGPLTISEIYDNLVKFNAGLLIDNTDEITATLRTKGNDVDLSKVIKTVSQD